MENYKNQTICILHFYYYLLLSGYVTNGSVPINILLHLIGGQPSSGCYHTDNIEIIFVEILVLH